ncbi:hypothetical protein L210DRAFT_3532233 [Boletus edulis BED1]|uniref:Uncharacterized protein n=1 Tax=Boletus edulis BED1 TaxID=1328754 RepID=A0AAD4C001_BOLED|nr:hypothetical protein L210DRAFT_3532233 [Boletus edulis BED1]
MYRLACKVGLDRLRDEAFAYIRSNLTEHNIIQELSCSLLSTHPELLEMELDVLYAHNTSPPVVAHFPELAQHNTNRELAHGVDIIIWIHTRLLKESPCIWPRFGSGPRQTASSGFGLRNVESVTERNAQLQAQVIHLKARFRVKMESRGRASPVTQLPCLRLRLRRREYTLPFTHTLEPFLNLHD